MVSSARADERDFPCDGCLVVGERGGGPRPLLVVLHGDEGGPSRVASVWTAIAKRRGVVALFPKCPREEGCTTGSYWRWNGEPSWLLAQVSKVEASYGIDPERRYLAGWSGGTTYLTFRFASWFPTFAAVSLTGGGARGGDGCPAGAGGVCAPALYRMGARNPLFDLADGARQELERCGHVVEWNVLPGLDHEGEWAAYVKDAERILDWLLVHDEGCAAVPATVPAPSGDSAVPAAAPSAAPSSAAERATAPSGAPLATPHCRCGVVGRDADRRGESAVFALGAIACAVVRRRAGRSRQSVAAPACDQSARRVRTRSLRGTSMGLRRSQ